MTRHIRQSRSIWLLRPLGVAGLAAAVLLLSDRLPVVHATLPYYPYECPIGSGGTHFEGGTRTVWDPRTGLWFSSFLGSDSAWGTWGDIPTPGDFNGEGSDDFAIFRPSTGTWWVQTPLGTLLVAWGTAGDIPVPADYDADGVTDYGVWRPSNGRWYVRNGATGATLVDGVAWGQFGDCPIAARLTFAGPGSMELNVWRPSNGVWYFGRSFTGTAGGTIPFGTYGDIPFAPDINGDGGADLVVFRPSTGTWYGSNPKFAIQWGQPGDLPAPRSRLQQNENSNLTVYRPTTGLEYLCFSPAGSSCSSTSTSAPFGSPGVVLLQNQGR